MSDASQYPSVGFFEMTPGSYMEAFRDAPIRRKVLLASLVTTATALLLAGAGIVLADALLFRKALERDLTVLASIAGENSAAALAFDDPRVATETLGALKARSHIVAACLYRANGTVLARYSRPGSSAPCPPPRATDGVESTRGGLGVSHAVVLRRGRIGTFVVLYDRGEMWERIKLNSIIVAIILLLASVAAFVLSSTLRDLIAGPISRLARAAAAVSESADYGIRVRKDSEDELGILVDAFNEMLRRIESRDLEVQNARNSLETTLTSIGDAVISTDTDGCIVFANPVARALLRCPDPDITGKQIDEVFRIVNELTHHPVESPVRRVLKEGVIVGLANHTVLIAGDGAEIPIDDSAAPIKQSGRTVGVVLVFRDVSERRRAQQDAAYLAAIVESSEDAIIGKSTDGVIQTWNAGAERVYGFKAEEVIGRPMRELLPADRQHEESGILERIRSGEQVVHFDTVRVRKDGTFIDVSLTISPIRNKAGRVVGVSHLARDITDEKRTAEQMRETQRLESLGVLAGGIAHDFNNLLTGILGNASIVLDDLPPGSPARQPLEAVISAGGRAAQLAQQMLAYSGKGRFVLEHVNLSERVRDILPLIRAAIPSTVQLELTLDRQLPPIEADAAQLEQLIMNVIINGAEAVPEGARGRLGIATRRLEVDEDYSRGQAGTVIGVQSPGSYVLFEVSDDGCGMDEATLARIFEPFFTTKFTGRGLGLAAVLGIMRGHRGSVQVSSKLGQGTVFRFLFPIAETTPELRQDAVAETHPGGRGEGLVLVIDDEQVIRDMARLALVRYGYEVLLAEDGSRGFDLFQGQADRIACVILDLTMPVMSGEETLAQMKAFREDVPVILTSGFNEVQAMRRFEGKGLAGFLQKPYQAAALVDKVRSVHRSDRRRAMGSGASTV